MERWQCWIRWWEGWRVGGPWPAWPSRGIRFDWIGAGDLCIKLRLPCDPVFHREIHTAVRGRACWGSPLTSHTLPDLTGFALPCWVMGSWVVLSFFFLVYSIPLEPKSVHSEPAGSDCLIWHSHCKNDIICQCHLQPLQITVYRSNMFS